MAERFAKGVSTGAYCKSVSVRKKSDLEKAAMAQKIEKVVRQFALKQGVEPSIAEAMIFGEAVDYDNPEKYVLDDHMVEDYGSREIDEDYESE